MAKRDVILRYAQIEQDYLDMTGLLKDLKEDLSKGDIDQGYFDSKAPLIEEEIDKIKSQYLVWAEMMFELNKPNRKNKKMNETEADWFKVIQTRTRECIPDNTRDCLAHLKQLIKEGKI